MKAARAIIAAIGVAIFAWPTAGHAAPPGSVYSSTYIRSADGTPLFAQVFRPATVPQGAKTPVIVLAGPYFGNAAYESGPYMTLPYYDDLFDAALARDYTIVQVTLRGFGASGGCSDWQGPGQQADVVAAVRWAASQPWSTGRVGMYGLSYDATSEVMALAAKDHVGGLDAAVIASGVTNVYGSFYMNRNRYTPFDETLLPYYQGYFLPPPDALSDPAAGQAILAQATSNPSCTSTNTSQQEDPDPSTPYWQARDWVTGAAGSTVPVLYSQGFIDANVKPDNFMGLWPLLRGPKRAWVGQYPHLIPGEVYALTGQPDPVGRTGFLAEAMHWFDHYLKQAPGSAAAVNRDPPVEVQEGSTGLWRSEQAWPPLDAHPAQLNLLDGSYQDQPGNKGEPYCLRSEPQCPPGSTGNGTWTFSQPLPYDIWIAGSPKLSTTLSAPATQVTLVSFLYDISPDGQATLITRGATTTGPGRNISFDLYPQDWRLTAGHRLAILLSGSDDGWFTPGSSGAQVSASAGTLTVPFLRYQRAFNLPGTASQDVQQRTTFTVDASMIPAHTVPEPLPPRLAPPPARPPACKQLRGRLRLKLPRHHGRIIKTLIFVNGHRVKTVRGRHLTAVSIRTPKLKRFTISLIAYTDAHRRLHLKRRYHRC